MQAATHRNGNYCAVDATAEAAAGRTAGLSVAPTGRQHCHNALHHSLWQVGEVSEGSLTAVELIHNFDALVTFMLVFRQLHSYRCLGQFGAICGAEDYIVYSASIDAHTDKT